MTEFQTFSIVASTLDSHSNAAYWSNLTTSSCNNKSSRVLDYAIITAMLFIVYTLCHGNVPRTNSVSTINKPDVSSCVVNIL